MGPVVGLLLWSVFVHAQHNKVCGPIPAGQPAKLCGSYSTPIYPPEAKAAGIEGTVKVFAQINKSGMVDLVWAVNGPEPLREAALNAVKGWIYRPYFIDGAPTGFRAVVNVKFRIKRQSTQPPQHD
jgi:protein TonB